MIKGGWTQEAKQFRVRVLEFIKAREVVGPADLVEQFGYTYQSAQGRLRRFIDAGLLQRIGRGEYCLTEKGYSRLSYYQKLRKEGK
jgi:predicted transcriptional regulator